MDTSEVPGTSITPDRIDLATVPRRRAAVASVVIGGETLLMDEETGLIHLLNASGGLVWACLDGVGTVSEIAADIASELGLPQDQVVQDVLESIRAIGQSGALEGVQP